MLIFYWDDTNFRLGLGVGAPQYSLHVGQTNKFQSFSDISSNTVYLASLFNNVVNNSLVPPANSLNNALEVNLDVDNTVASASWMGVSSNVGTHAGSGTSVGTFVGASLNAFHNGTASVAALYGNKSSVVNNSTGTVVDANALSAMVVNNGSGVINNGFGLNVMNGNKVGPVSSNTGLLVNTLSNTLNGISTTGGYFGFAATLWMPNQGGNTSGTNYNYGLVVEGNGGTAGVGGTVNNVALAVAANYPSYFSNWISVNQVNIAPVYPIDCAGDIAVTLVGHGFRVKEGSNAKQGTAVLVGGTVVVANTSVTSTSRIFLTTQTPGGTPGSLYISARTPGTSFTVTSTSGADTSTLAFLINEVA